MQTMTGRNTLNMYALEQLKLPWWFTRENRNLHDDSENPGLNLALASNPESCFVVQDSDGAICLRQMKGESRCCWMSEHSAKNFNTRLNDKAMYRSEGCRWVLKLVGRQSGGHVRPPTRCVDYPVFNTEICHVLVWNRSQRRGKSAWLCVWKTKMCKKKKKNHLVRIWSKFSEQFDESFRSDVSVPSGLWESVQYCMHWFTQVCVMYSKDCPKISSESGTFWILLLGPSTNHS